MSSQYAAALLLTQDAEHNTQLHAVWALSTTVTAPAKYGAPTSADSHHCSANHC
jgi:hypothetical protein